jgi:hypothetical protein
VAEDEVVKAISTVMEALTPLDKEAREHALDFVMKRLGIAVTKPAASPTHSAFTTPPPPIPSHVPPPVHAHAQVSGADIRSFAVLKSPKTMNEKVALMAYYLSQLAPAAERRDFITPEDIKPYFIQAGFELPTATGSMTLTNAKNAGYLNVLERGQYKLNSVGHNLVAHKLPKKEGGSQQPRRSKPIKKTSKR